MPPIQMYPSYPVEEQTRDNRSLTENHSQENQGAAFTEDDLCYKVRVDVQDFLESGVKFDIVNENELIVEGHTESEEDSPSSSSSSRKTFFRRFLFPSLVRLDSVSSVMSCDGILTITIAKQVTSESRTGRIS